MCAARTVCIKGEHAAVFMAALTRLLPDRKDGHAFVQTEDFETEQYATVARAVLTEKGTCPPVPSDADFRWSLFVNGLEVAVFQLTSDSATGDSASVRFVTEPATDALVRLNAATFPSADILTQESTGHYVPSVAFVDFVKCQLVSSLRDAETGLSNDDLSAAVESLYAAVCELQPWQTSEVFLEKIRACTSTYRALLERDPDRKLLDTVEQTLIARVTDWVRQEKANSSAFLADAKAFATDIIAYDQAAITQIDHSNRRRQSFTSLSTWFSLVLLLFLLPLMGLIVSFIYFYGEQ